MLDVVRAVRERTVALDLAREQQQQQQQQQQEGQLLPLMTSPSDATGSTTSSNPLPPPPPEALAFSAQRGLAVALSLGELPSDVYQVKIEPVG